MKLNLVDTRYVLLYIFSPRKSNKEPLSYHSFTVTPANLNRTQLWAKILIADCYSEGFT